MGTQSAHIYTHLYESPVGVLYLAVTKTGRVVRISFDNAAPFSVETVVEENKYACGELEYQLERYFQGELRAFSLEVELGGTEFQKSVWGRLLKIPFGTTLTYGEVAQKVGRRNAARAVGNAVASNPVPILVPCHRVLPAAGGIGNYALHTFRDGSGSRTKRYLLELEGALATEQAAS